ncbi:amidase [Agaricicola taiwanensis]|uniref:Amidase n=1 Tax=Agaricicola taiwanensis TaxID=591372 RepID=A0A8J2YIS2_9RHOB|nr:L,D-transpeptidase family protein [Agaricicola taiwanensis]GGE46405.1 amidase [Agaricicola taiwanensis]
MKKQAGFGTSVSGNPLSRRQLLGYGAGLVAAGALASKAQAQNATQMAQVEWGSSFDGGVQVSRLPSTSVPLLSEQTVQATELALQDYIRIEQQGGWQMVPATSRLELGQRHPNVIALRQRLAVSGDFDPNAGMSDIFDSYVEAAVKRFQARHGLLVTGVVGEAMLSALNVPASTRRQQLETNLVRLRSMSGNLGQRYVVVNIPAASIEAVEDGIVHSRHIAVVGKADRPSPVMTARIIDINFNPFWTVPASIVRKDLIPKMQADPGYLTKNKIRIYTQRGEELQPEQVNWTTDEATNYMFKQDPGDINSLGSVRINLPNKDAVYMHDTPAKNIFGENARFHSSGCVRVQNVRELVSWLLKESPGDWTRQKIDAVIRSGERIDAKIAQPVPVYWVYISAWGGADGVPQFHDDIYGRDGIGPIAQVQQ